jgi:hypothetical protein
VLWLDRRADVDGGKDSKDERLDRDDDRDLECVERACDRNEHDQRVTLDDEDQAEEGQDQQVA